MHLHILGICGTFMGGIALLARALGHRVTGSDANVYPPMSTQLEAAGIGLMEGYAASHLDPAPDLVVVGNAMKRGLPVVEYLLDRGLPYVSGPEWLKVNLLRERWVLAVAGTHGKTTASSMLAWVLDYAGLNPGFLIGGVPRDFGLSARLGAAPFFVVEADEYDTAFFDKRSKFVHYLPRTLILNNLEFDHADIFDDLAMIQRQFHHLVRIVPGSGLIIHPQGEAALEQVLAMGCWTPREAVGAGGDWSATLLAPDGSRFRVHHRGRDMGEVSWGQTGHHNVANALAVLAASRHAGVPLAQGLEALNRFQGVKRRMELRGVARGIPVYDDFAHHPTAIATTLEGLRRHAEAGGVGGRILAILEPRSNTMRLGVHNATLAASLEAADQVFVLAPPDLGWDAGPVFAPLGARVAIYSRIEDIVAAIAHQGRPGDQVLVMSNGGFQGIHERLLAALDGGH
ncbi:MAG: UDP-N-acetylmuramate:L-alanyl-gamma-D-glutamyl-meso-diaminopimelate ligase [Chromatiaceae bacterium]|nr:UDP-N-acetylmuramate:L-alanyl-gamma-D-glutamyl-meso-diaminopimelate ligase [Chromatiaceae bacterium]